jgi:hypothetical protein
VVGSFVGYYSFNFASQTDPSCLNPQKLHLNFSVDSYFISFLSHFFSFTLVSLEEVHYTFLLKS